MTPLTLFLRTTYKSCGSCAYNFRVRNQLLVLVFEASFCKAFFRCPWVSCTDGGCFFAAGINNGAQKLFEELCMIG
jgi:hypothetical protein